jgi:hypothetical protein
LGGFLSLGFYLSEEIDRKGIEIMGIFKAVVHIFFSGDKMIEMLDIFMMLVV